MPTIEFQEKYRLTPPAPVDQTVLARTARRLETRFTTHTDLRGIFDDLDTIDRMGRSMNPAFLEAARKIGRDPQVKTSFTEALKDADDNIDSAGVLQLVRVGHLMRYTEDPTLAPAHDKLFQEHKAELDAIYATPTRDTTWEAGATYFGTQWHAISGTLPTRNNLTSLTERFETAFDIFHAYVFDGPKETGKVIKFAAGINTLFLEVWPERRLMVRFFNLKGEGDIVPEDQLAETIFLPRDIRETRRVNNTAFLYGHQYNLDPDQIKGIKTMYRYISQALHPDKYPYPITRERNSQFFKRINTEYYRRVMREVVPGFTP